MSMGNTFIADQHKSSNNCFSSQKNHMRIEITPYKLITITGPCLFLFLQRHQFYQIKAPPITSFKLNYLLKLFSTIQSHWESGLRHINAVTGGYDSVQSSCNKNISYTKIIKLFFILWLYMPMPSALFAIFQLVLWHPTSNHHYGLLFTCKKQIFQNSKW